MVSERELQDDDLTIHCPVAEQRVDDPQNVSEEELICNVLCRFYGKTRELCGKIREEKANNDGSVSRETRYIISDKIAPHCPGPRKIGYPHQDRFAKRFGEQ